MWYLARVLATVAFLDALLLLWYGGGQGIPVILLALAVMCHVSSTKKGSSSP